MLTVLPGPRWRSKESRARDPKDRFPPAALLGRHRPSDPQRAAREAAEAPLLAGSLQPIGSMQKRRSKAESVSLLRNLSTGQRPSTAPPFP
jgi:hypothetical protein